MEALKVTSLPVRAEDVFRFRRERSLSVQVRDLLNRHWEDEDLRVYLAAECDEQAEQGNLKADDIFAAMRLRELGDKDGNAFVASSKVGSIDVAIRHVLSSVKQSRRQRLKRAGAVDSAVPGE